MCAYESGLLCESGSSNAGDQTNVPESIKGSQTNSSDLGLSLVDKNSPNSKTFHVKPEITKNRLIQTEVTASQQFLPSSSVDDIEPNEASRKTKYALGKVPFELDIKANKLSLKSILDTIKRRLSPSTNSKEDREAQSSEYSSNSDNDENEKEADSDSDYVCTDELIPTSSTFNTSKEQLFIGDTFICRMCDMIVTKSVLKQHTDWCFRSQSALKLQQELLYAVINLIKDLKLETKSIPKSEEQSLKYAHGLCDILETASYIRESKIPSILARKFKNPSGKLSRLISDTSSIPTDGVLDSLLAFGTKAVELLSRKKTLAKEILGLYAEYLDLDSLNAVENYQGNILFTNNDAIESTGDISSQMVLDEIKTLETDHKDEENNGPPIGTHNSDENTDDLSIHTVHQVREKLVHEARRKKEFANDGRFQTPISKLTTLFSNILKASSNTLQTYSPAIQKSLFGAKFSKIKFPTALSVAISDFEVLRLISRGTFGSVLEARKIRTDEIFAIKVIEKRELIRKKITDQVLTERHILAQLSHPLISKLYYAFSTESHLFLVMEYFSGGDLASVIKKIKRLSVDAAQFYAAQLVLAVEHMHKNSFVHRDIKPDNILLDDVGHLKLSDFGVAAVLDSSGQANGKEGRIIGTPNYIPPEVVSSKGEKWTQTTAFDIWSLGIVLFEFLVGIPPLNASQTGEIFSKIVNFTHIDWTNYSDVDIPVSAINLIDKLLRLDPSARLDFAGIKSHEFFKTIDWENIESKRAPEEVLWAMKDMKESIDLNEKRLKEDEEDLIAFCKALGTTIGDDVRGQPNNIINDLKDSRICGPSDLSSRRTGVSSRTIDAVDVSDDEYAQHGFLNHFKGFEYVNLKLLREINNASC